MPGPVLSTEPPGRRPDPPAGAPRGGGGQEVREERRGCQHGAGVRQVGTTPQPSLGQRTACEDTRLMHTPPTQFIDRSDRPCPIRRPCEKSLKIVLRMIMRSHGALMRIQLINLRLRGYLRVRGIGLGPRGPAQRPPSLPSTHSQ